MTDIPKQLTRLARLYGVQTSYRDMRHQTQKASVESLLAVLQMLGAEVADVDDVGRALISREHELLDRIAEPVVVAWDGNSPPIRIRTSRTGPAKLRYTVVLEGVDESRTKVVAMSKLATTAQHESYAESYV